MESTCRSHWSRCVFDYVQALQAVAALPAASFDSSGASYGSIRIQIKIDFLSTSFQAVAALPPANRALLRALRAFLAKFVAEEAVVAVTKMTVCRPSMFRTDQW